MDEEKKICTPQHSINGYVPQPNDLQYHMAVCDCKRLTWISVRCGCPADTVNPTFTLQARPNEQ